MHFHWQIKQINTIDGMYSVDRNAAFGGRGSGRIWISFNALVMWIVIFVKFLPWIFAYADDEFSFDLAGNVLFYPKYNKFLPEKQVQLLELWDELGIPHKEKKQVFGPVLKIIGFEVDVNRMTYTMPQSSKTDLIAALRHFTSPSGKNGRRFTLREYQRIAGWANWALNVFPLLRPGLCGLYTKIAGKDKPNAKIWVNNNVRADLDWMADHMEQSTGVHILKSLDWNLADADTTIYCDASLEGMGFWYPELRLGFHCPIDFKVPDGGIFFFEALCVCAAFHDVAELGFHTTTLVTYTDNKNTVDIFNSLRASEVYNPILKSTINIALANDFHFRVLHVPGVENTVADALSRNNLALALSLVPDLQIQTFLPPQDALGALRK
jgi:hypothetical protein